MTDFDTEMMREDKPPLPLAADKDPLREPPRVLAADPALIAAMTAGFREDQTFADPTSAAAQPALAEAARQDPQRRPAAVQIDPEAEAVAARATVEAEARANAEAKEAAARQDMAATARQRLLTRALAALLQAPEAARLEPLLASFATVPAAEAAQAADAIMALYLRAGADARRRMRPALAAALTEGPRGALALALAARLGALAMSAAPPPAPPPPPPEP